MGSGNLVFPDPISTFKETGRLLSSAYIWKCIGWTLLRTLIGFVISFVAAIIIGTIAGNYSKFATFLKPLMVVLKSIPTAALVFLFLVMSGSKWAPVYIVIILSFPILYESVVGGISNISEDIINALKLESHSTLYGIVRVKVPLATPYILVGLSSSFALSIKTEIMAEIITGSTDKGLGCAIQAYRNSDPSNLTPIFAISLIAIVIVLLIDLLEFVVKKKVHITQ